MAGGAHVNLPIRGVDFIGTDLRDTNLSGTNLSTSIFLTQMQINSAKGNDKTILPVHTTTISLD